MMKQYFEIKKNYPDTILMFRLGDFYEMFFDDAKLVSAELELVLTGRDCGQEERAPMCGVPYHAVEGYIGKLVGKVIPHLLRIFQKEDSVLRTVIACMLLACFLCWRFCACRRQRL